MKGGPLRIGIRLVDLERAQRLPPEVLAARRDLRLRRLLRHAYERTRLYRERFEARGLTPEDIPTASALRRLPILHKEDLRRHDDILADGFARERLHTSFTSGSTGQGMPTFFDPDAWSMGRYLLKLRARLACGVRPWDRIAQFQWIPNRDTLRRRLLLRQRSFGVDVPFERVLPEVIDYAPSVLYGFPGYLRRLGAHAGGRLRSRLIFTSGEILSGEHRTDIERAFGATVYDVYGCTEVKEIAWECTERTGYHINADWVVVEVLERAEEGAPAGSLLVTSLFNYAMPIIRYLVGDAGRLIEGSCRCGRTLPLMAPDTGRLVDYVRLPRGGEVSPYTVMEPVEAHPHVDQFEIIQRTLGRVLVRVVPLPSWTDAEAEDLRARLAPVLPDVVVDVEIVRRIDPTPGGKYRIVRSYVTRPHQGDATPA